MFDVKTECPVCNTTQKSDILYHGPGAAGLWWECGHEMHCTKDKTTYTENGKIVKEEIK